MLEDIVRLLDNNQVKRQLEETEINLGSRVQKKTIKVKMEPKIRTISLRLSWSPSTQMVLAPIQT